MAHVFISYAREDRDFAEILIRKLGDAGFESWFDAQNLRAGKDWQQEIDDAIRASFVVIVIITPSAKKSEYVTYEWSFGLGLGLSIIPVMRESTELHSRLKTIHHLDFTGSYRPWDELLDELRNIYSGYDRNTSRITTNHTILDDTEKYQIKSLIDDLLDERNPQLQVAAAKVIGHYRNSTAVDGLIETLRSQHWEVRVAAAEALGNVGDRKAVPRLLVLLQGDSEFWVKVATARALGQIGDEIAVPALIELISDLSFDINQRIAGIEALGEIGSPEAIPALIKYLDNAYSQEIGNPAYYALLNIGTPEAIEATSDYIPF